ncbi:MAG: Fpg/Nei family DNA glycosylase [Acidimicrobiia bacterium]|nr:Fpg/Nei family DNA glycosylase [Acidimicrobiia bacterium]
MPEGDTVLVAARRLHEALAGKAIRRSDLRMPRIATADLSGQTVLGVAARGKHILLRTDAGLTLHTHFTMDGTWHLYQPGEKWRGPGFQVRAVIETTDVVAVGFRLGICELIRTADETQRLRHLGPDVLGGDWDRNEAIRRLGTHPEREAGTMLIDQRVMAGPGNIYKSEVCFLERLNPWTALGDVADPTRLVDRMKELMEANREAGRQITTGDSRPGHERWVAGRWRLACRRCGSQIRKADQASYDFERVTYWCPTCQPAPPA